MNSLFKLLVCVSSCLAIIGCSQPSSKTEAPTSTQDSHGHAHDGGIDDHDHGHSHGEAPHGGTIFDWGGGAYHAEFTVNHEQQEVTVYILGSDAKTPAPIKADNLELVIDEPETEIELKASPLDGEGNGMSSRFVAKHETIGIVREFSGSVSGLVDGTPYSGDFKELPHEHDH